MNIYEPTHQKGIIHTHTNIKKKINQSIKHNQNKYKHTQTNKTSVLMVGEEDQRYP